MTEKATNPKDVIGGDNLPLHLVPYAVKVLTAIGLFNGAGKYGRANYRVGGVQATVYLDAAERHLEGIKNGEELDPVDGVPHLCGLFASAAIYADAWAHGYLIDNRMPRPKGFRAWVDKMTTHIPRLRKLHEGKDPRHYTIEDTPVSGDAIVRNHTTVTAANAEGVSGWVTAIRPPIPPLRTARGEPYEGVTHEENRGRLGCSFLKGLLR